MHFDTWPHIQKVLWSPLNDLISDAMHALSCFYKPLKGSFCLDVQKTKVSLQLGFCMQLHSESDQTKIRGIFNESLSIEAISLQAVHSFKFSVGMLFLTLVSTYRHSCMVIVVILRRKPVRQSKQTKILKCTVNFKLHFGSSLRSKTFVQDKQWSCQ